MGQCFGKPAPASGNGIAAALHAKTAAVANITTQVHPNGPQEQTAALGLKVLPTSAVLRATGKDASSTVRVEYGRNYVFAALFEGLCGKEAAEICRAKCYELYLSAPDKKASSALSHMFKQLDAELLSAAQQSVALAGCGAMGCAAVINTVDHKVTVAAVGSCHSMTTYGVGSFVTGTAETIAIADGTLKIRPALDALLRLEGRQPSSQSDYELVSGLREHVLGFGAFKEPALGRAYSEHVIAAARAAAAAAAAKKKGSKKGKGAAGAGQQEAPLPPPVPALARFEGGCTVQVGSRPIGVNDESVVLASDGLLDLLSPVDAATLVHHFEASHMQQLLDAATLGTINGMDLNINTPAKPTPAHRRVPSGTTPASPRGAASPRPSSPRAPASPRTSTPANRAPSSPRAASASSPANARSPTKPTAGAGAGGVGNKTPAGKQAANAKASPAKAPGATPPPAPKPAANVKPSPSPAKAPAAKTPSKSAPPARQPTSGEGMALGVPRTFNLANLMIHHAASKLATKRYPAAGGVSLAGATPGVLKRDAVLLVVSFDWPKSLTTAQLSLLKHMKARGVSGSPMAAYRWQLLRGLMRFMWLRRPRLLGKWRDTVAVAGKAAEKARREAEVLAWRHLNEAVQVHRTGLVMRSNGGAVANNSSGDPADVSAGGASLSEAGSGRGSVTPSRRVTTGSVGGAHIPRPPSAASPAGRRSTVGGSVGGGATDSITGSGNSFGNLSPAAAALQRVARSRGGEVSSSGYAPGGTPPPVPRRRTMRATSDNLPAAARTTADSFASGATTDSILAGAAALAAELAMPLPAASDAPPAADPTHATAPEGVQEAEGASAVEAAAATVPEGVAVEIGEVRVDMVVSRAGAAAAIAKAGKVSQGLAGRDLEAEAETEEDRGGYDSAAYGADSGDEGAGVMMTPQPLRVPSSTRGSLGGIAASGGGSSANKKGSMAAAYRLRRTPPAAM